MGVIIQTVLSNCSTTLKSNQIVFIPFLPIISCCALCNVKLTSNPPSMTSSVTRAHWGSCQWTATPPEVFRGSYCAHRFHRKRRSSHTPVQHQLGSQKRWDKAVWVLGQKSVVPFLLPCARGIASCHTWFTWCSTLGSVDILNLLVGILILLVERLTRLNCGFSAASYHCLPLSIHIWKPSPTHILSWCGVPVSWCVVKATMEPSAAGNIARKLTEEVLQRDLVGTSFCLVFMSIRRICVLLISLLEVQYTSYSVLSLLPKISFS